jgi:hypothetical protein
MWVPTSTADTGFTRYVSLNAWQHQDDFETKQTSMVSCATQAMQQQ